MGINGLFRRMIDARDKIIKELHRLAETGEGNFEDIIPLLNKLESEARNEAIDKLVSLIKSDKIQFHKDHETGKIVDISSHVPGKNLYDLILYAK